MGLLRRLPPTLTPRTLPRPRPSRALAPYAFHRSFEEIYRSDEGTPFDAGRLRALAADLAACGSTQTAAIVRDIVAEIEGE